MDRLNLEKDFEELVSLYKDRRFEQLEMCSEEDARVQALYGRKAELHKRVTNALPEELKKDMLEYDSIEGNIAFLKEELFYERGFKDAFTIVRAVFRLFGGGRER